MIMRIARRQRRRTRMPLGRATWTSSRPKGQRASRGLERSRTDTEQRRPSARVLSVASTGASSSDTLQPHRINREPLDADSGQFSQRTAPVVADGKDLLVGRPQRQVEGGLVAGSGRQVARRVRRDAGPKRRRRRRRRRQFRGEGQPRPHLADVDVGGVQRQTDGAQHVDGAAGAGQHGAHLFADARLQRRPRAAPQAPAAARPRPRQQLQPLPGQRNPLLTWSTRGSGITVPRQDPPIEDPGERQHDKRKLRSKRLVIIYLTLTCRPTGRPNGSHRRTTADKRRPV